jgi:hypothetical protein
VRFARPGTPLRSRSPRAALAVLLAAGIVAATPAPAVAQLRPLEPTNWQILHRGGTLSVGVGAGVFHRQRASLAGVEGRLVEVGDVRIDWRTGRVALEAGGTVQRRLDRYTRYAEPTGGARHATGERLTDSGAWRIATVVRLTGEDAPATLALRFGTRLPNPDNRVGLDRDQTDFFATVGGYAERAGVSLGLETGLGIHGTRNPEYEQSDVLLYAARLDWRRGVVAPRLLLLGHLDGNRGIRLRGNEDLGEMRAGVRLGRRWWVEADVVRGFVPSSPGSGLRLASGTTR